MSPDGLWSIGELAEHAGVTVKTVRFYSERGLLPEAARSSGGHRRYGPAALDRLRLIRSLRALDLPVPEVSRVLGADDGLSGTLEDAIADRLREVSSQLSALRWREAALHLLRDCPEADRAERLRLVGAVAAPPSTAALARFWRRLLPVRLPARLVSAILDQAVPAPPADPTPAQVLAFARLHALAIDPRALPADCGPDRRPAEPDCRSAVLYDGLGEAYVLGAAELLAHRAPAAGAALDCFVAAHAAAGGARDTPAFRRRLATVLDLTADPVVERYWRLAAELTGPADPNLGAAHDWLRAALTAELAGSAA